MNLRSTVAAAFVVLALSATSARAEYQVAPDGTVIRQTTLERACVADLARFCPALAETPGQTRNQVICLKPYRTSLASYCRKAVNAAMK